jgi:hypothetical protein
VLSRRKIVTTKLQQRRDGDVRLGDYEATTASATSVPLRTPRIDSTEYYYGTALGWSELGVFVRVPGDQARVSDRSKGDR